MNRHPKIIGITGGISSGKSAIGRMLASLGSEYIDADEMCHRLFLVHELKNKIVERFGNTVQDIYGKIDRSRLGEIVFQDKTCLDDLCSILHPIVIERIKSKITEIEKQGRRKAIVIDAALLEESDLSSICDFIIFVNASRDRRLERSKISRHWKEEELDKENVSKWLWKIKKESRLHYRQ